MSEVKYKSFRNVAMVELPPTRKTEQLVFRYLTVHGYNVVPVNPIEEVYGRSVIQSERDSGK